MFIYTAEMLEVLKRKDAKLKSVIEQVGLLERATDDDLFDSLVSAIVGQQISGKAFISIYGRLKQLTV